MSSLSINYWEMGVDVFNCNCGFVYFLLYFSWFLLRVDCRSVIRFRIVMSPWWIPSFYEMTFFIPCDIFYSEIYLFWYWYSHFSFLLISVSIVRLLHPLHFNQFVSLYLIKCVFLISSTYSHALQNNSLVNVMDCTYDSSPTRLVTYSPGV